MSPQASASDPVSGSFLILPFPLSFSGQRLPTFAADVVLLTLDLLLFALPCLAAQVSCLARDMQDGVAFIRALL